MEGSPAGTRDPVKWSVATASPGQDCPASSEHAARRRAAASAAARRSMGVNLAQRGGAEIEEWLGEREEGEIPQIGERERPRGVERPFEAPVEEGERVERRAGIA